MFRPKIFEIGDACTGCGACANICPQGCISMMYDSEGFYVPVLRESCCVDCGMCERHCHILSPNSSTPTYKPNAFVCWSLNEETRKLSSSGGVFSELSECFQNKGGVVFGACYNFEKEQLEHANTDRVSLAELRKSKYIESNTLNTFREVRDFLKQGRWVLYCGTPCQISGLRKFLEDISTDKLLLVNFICLGVPSNKHFTEYKHELEKKYGAKLNYLNFRPKTKGWHHPNYGIGFGNKRYFMTCTEDVYYRSFYNKLLLRPSCYMCEILKKNLSDITLADFWNIKKFTPELDDNKGASFVVINTEKGNKIFKEISSKIFSKSLPDESITVSYYRGSKVHLLRNRNSLIKKISEVGYFKTMTAYHRKGILIYKIMKNIKKIIKI